MRFQSGDKPLERFPATHQCRLPSHYNTERRPVGIARITRNSAMPNILRALLCCPPHSHPCKTHGASRQTEMPRLLLPNCQRALADLQAALGLRSPERTGAGTVAACLCLLQFTASEGHSAHRDANSIPRKFDRQVTPAGFWKIFSRLIPMPETETEAEADRRATPVETMGLEPTTPGLQSRCSPS